MRRLIALASLFLLTASVSFAGEWTGWVTDQKCAKQGKAGEGHAGCAQGCIKGGEPAVLVVDGKIYELDAQDKVKEHAGHKVTVSGSEADGKITVESVKMAS